MTRNIRNLSAQTAERLVQSHVLSKRHAWSVLKASGEKIRDYLQGQITQDINNLNTHQGIHACLLSPQGKAIGDLYIVEGQQHELIILTPTQDTLAVVERLRRFAIGFDVRIGHVASMGVCTVQGANAAEALALFAVDEPERIWLACQHAKDADITAMVMPVDPVGFWVVAPDHVIDTVLSHSNDAVIAEEEIEAMCVMRGLPRFGVDWTHETHPLNANLIEFAGVSFDKGCYVGQEVTSRMHWRGGIRKKLYKVIIQGHADQIGTLPSPVFIDDSETKIGELTSVAIDHEGVIYGICMLPIDIVDAAKPLSLSNQCLLDIVDVCHV